MTDLRAETVALLYDAFGDRPLCERVAAAILALPEIAEMVAVKEIATTSKAAWQRVRQ